MVATVTGLHQPVWAEGSSEWELGAKLRAGRRVLLDSGLVEITFVDGAQTVLEGPCRFTADARGAGTLEVGSLAANVPPKAIGFTVRTPTASIEDLGTKFGVRVDVNGATEAIVFEGEVEFGPAAGPVSTAPTIKLKSGQAARRTSNDLPIATIEPSAGLIHLADHPTRLTRSRSLNSWSSLRAITSNDDIVNPSGVVAAINFGANGDIPIKVGSHTFTFTQDSVGDLPFGGGNFDESKTAVAEDSDRVLDTFIFNNGGLAPTTLTTFSGLTGGETYTVQIFASDDNTNWAGYSFTIDGVSSDPLTTAGADPNGSSFSPFSFATVTLDAAQTSFDLGISSGGASVVSALVLAKASSVQAAVPEPSSLLVCSCLGIVGLCCRASRRRRRRARAA